MFGLGFVHESGVTAAGPNSGQDDRVLRLDAGEGAVDFHLERLPLQPGTYLVSAAIVDRGHVYDYVDRGFELRVRVWQIRIGRARAGPVLRNLVAVRRSGDVTFSREASWMITGAELDRAAARV